MYAVFRTGGKQYRASEGERVRIERMDAQEGDSVEFDQVLMVGNGAEVQVGSPLVEDGLVTGIVTAQGRGRKVVVTKFKRRKNYKRIKGHRQHFTEVKITSIGAQAGDASAAAPEIDDASAAVPEIDDASAAVPETGDANAASPETGAAGATAPETGDTGNGDPGNGSADSGSADSGDADAAA